MSLLSQSLILGCSFALDAVVPPVFLLADLATYEKAVQLMTGKYSYLFYSPNE